MAIDESAGVRYRKCKVFPSAGSSYVAAVLSRHPEGWSMDVYHTRSLKALIRRGMVEEFPHPHNPWYKLARLTAAGRAAAEASPAVREWIEGWNYVREMRCKEEHTMTKTDATRIMDAEGIEALNRAACAKVRIPHEAMDDPAHRDALYYGLQAVARERGLILARYAGGDPDKLGTSEGPQCEVYRDPHTGTFVNLWVEGDAFGFDDQVDLND